MMLRILCFYYLIRIIHSLSDLYLSGGQRQMKQWREKRWSSDPPLVHRRDRGWLHDGHHHRINRHPGWYAASDLELSSENEVSGIEDEEEETPTLVDVTPPEALLRAVTFSNMAKSQEPALLCDYLLEIGACSVSITDADRGTDRENPLFGEPKRRGSGRDDLDTTEVWGSYGVWDYCNVTAHFPATMDIEGFVLSDETLRIFFPSSWQEIQYRVERIPNKDWVVHVQQGWKPIVVANRFILTFPWHEAIDIDNAVTAAASSSRKNDNSTSNKNPLLQIKLQGGIAFGTGEHATTQLCLEWLDWGIAKLLGDFSLTSRSMEGSDKETEISVLDYGSGSGILGIAACSLHPQRVRAVGVDIDADACQIANANARSNGVCMRTYLPSAQIIDDSNNDDVSRSLFLKAQRRIQGTHPVIDDSFLVPPPNELGNDRYDVCVANILAPALVELAPILYGMLKPGGLIGLSGILSHQSDTIMKTYRSAGYLNIHKSSERDGWVLITGRKPAS